LPNGSEEELRSLLGTVRTRAEYERVLCVWLRVALGLSSREIAKALDWQPSSVRRLQARYREQGSAALLTPGRGGRRRALLSFGDEQQLLAGFASRAGEGGIGEASVIRLALEQKAGHPVAKSTLYRLLDRHGWRKLAPRPRHIQADPKAQEAFKKSSLASCSPKRCSKPSKTARCD
jgi:transposase